jgi:hypothetical protein
MHRLKERDWPVIPAGLPGEMVHETGYIILPAEAARDHLEKAYILTNETPRGAVRDHDRAYSVRDDCYIYRWRRARFVIDETAVRQ